MGMGWSTQEEVRGMAAGVGVGRGGGDWSTQEEEGWGGGGLEYPG